MPIYRANCVVRNKTGREVASRYPLWTGAADDARGAVAAATTHLGELDLPPDADTIVVTVRGPGAEVVVVTEYAEDVLAGRVVSADMSTLLSDAADQSPDDRRVAIERIKAEAVAVMPELARRAAAKQAERPDAPAGESATVQASSADPLQDFFGPGWKPTVKSAAPCADDAIFPAAGGDLWQNVYPLTIEEVRESMRRMYEQHYIGEFVFPIDRIKRRPDNPPKPIAPPLIFKDGEVKAVGGTYARGGPVNPKMPVPWVSDFLSEIQRRIVEEVARQPAYIFERYYLGKFTP